MDTAVNAADLFCQISSDQVSAWQKGATTKLQSGTAGWPIYSEAILCCMFLLGWVLLIAEPVSL